MEDNEFIVPDGTPASEAKLAEKQLYTMGDIARCSLGSEDDFYNEDLLYKLFGVNAELLIDHAWGWEPCTIADIKAYKPENNSISQGQVLQSPYPFQKAKLVMKEMTDLLILDLVSKRLVAGQMVLTVGYDTESLADPVVRAKYKGEVAADWYGRAVPKQAHGSVNLGGKTSSEKIIMDAVMALFDRIVHPDLLVRRMYIVANHVTDEAAGGGGPEAEQLDLFTDYAARAQAEAAEETRLARERQKQTAILEIKKKFGANAIVKALSLEEGATAIDRNQQVGGHKA